MAIAPEATAIHGKTIKDLINCPRSETAKLPADAKYLVGHNINYDFRCLGKPEGYLLIDTLPIMRNIKKFTETTFNTESNKLDDLLLDMCPKAYAEFENGGIHSSIGDCFKVLLLLERILWIFPTICHWDELYSLQELGKKKDKKGKKK
jgi:exodeoxyribonuclease X